MAKKTKKKTGRKSKYVEMGISQKLKSIEGWARQGSTQGEIAEMLGVSEATLYRWKGQFWEFREALRVGAREATGEILNSAFRQATGYREMVSECIKQKKIAYVKDEKGRKVMLKDSRGNPVLEDVEKIIEYEKYFPPDAKMTQFMLLNRFPEGYKHKPEAEGEKETIIEHFIPEENQNGENSTAELQADTKADTLPCKSGG